MKLFLSFLLVWLSIINSQSCQKANTAVFDSDNRQSNQVVKSSEWKNADYKGLEIGKSSERDMIRILGKPVWSGLPEGVDKNDPYAEVWHDYELKGNINGKLTVAVKSKDKIIREIFLQPEKLSKDSAIKIFGENYKLTKYNEENCSNGDDEADYDLYESEKGKIIQLEYRERGIALRLNDKNDVTDIFYVSEPMGNKKPRCSNLN